MSRFVLYAGALDAASGLGSGNGGELVMVPDDLREFFAASASVAGALVGLLFVAVSVVGDKLRSHDGARSSRLRAAAALTAFTNALVVSLLALVPGDLAATAQVVAIVGLVFVGAGLISLRHVRQVSWSVVRDVLFLVGLVAIFIDQLLNAIDLDSHPNAPRTVADLATLVVICFLVGIARSWELIGGPTIGLGSEAIKLGRDVVSNRGGNDHHDAHQSVDDDRTDRGGQS